MPYYQYVKTIVGDFANNPWIMAWQLGNELQAVNADQTCNESEALSAMQSWGTAMGQLIRSEDTNHLISFGNVAGYTGSGLQYCGSANYDYQTLGSNPYDNLLDYHDYWYTGTEQPGLVDALKMAQADNKPFMVAEAGIEVPGQVSSDAIRAADFCSKFSAWNTSGVVGGLVWNWLNPNNGFEVLPGDPLLNKIGACGLGNGL